MWQRFVQWLATDALGAAYRLGRADGISSAVAEAYRHEDARRRAYWQGREHAVAIISVTAMAREQFREAHRSRILRVRP